MNGNFPIANHHSDTAGQPEPTAACSFRRHQLIHLQLYASWALASLVTGGVCMFFTTGYWHHFHHMNAAWGSINLIIAGILWRKFRSPTIDTKTNQELQFRRLLRINLCLDIVYIVAGGWLQNYDSTSIEESTLVEGFGQAIILQGVVLLFLDASSLSIWIKRLRKL